jgi:hypothetical protein
MIFCVIAILIFILWFLFLAFGSKPNSTSIPVINNGEEIEFNVPYNLAGDSEYMVRIKQEWPEGIGTSLIKKCGPYRYGLNVTGVSKPEHEELVTFFVLGSNWQVFLEREPDNSHDKNAIKVCGKWTNRNGKIRNGHLGYVPAFEAKLLKNEPIIGAKLTALFYGDDNHSSGIRIEIGRPSLRSQKKNIVNSKRRSSKSNTQSNSDEEC